MTLKTGQNHKNLAKGITMHSFKDFEQPWKNRKEVYEEVGNMSMTIILLKRILNSLFKNKIKYKKI